MQGGAAQGIGWALNEEYFYDERRRAAEPGFLDYRMPVASDLPMIDTVIVEVPQPGPSARRARRGRGADRAPLAAVANALTRPPGTRIRDLPLSPPRVLAAIGARG